MSESASGYYTVLLPTTPSARKQRLPPSSSLAKVLGRYYAQQVGATTIVVRSGACESSETDFMDTSHCHQIL